MKAVIKKSETNGKDRLNPESLPLTSEQSEIISSPLKAGQTTLITARAGAGKTSTLAELVKANPDKQFLYLAFNKATATEAGQRFPANCDTKTTHSLAFRHEGWKYHEKGGFWDPSLSDIRASLGLCDFTEAYWIRESLNFFLRSGAAEVAPEYMRGGLHDDSYVKKLHSLWSQMCKTDSSVRQSHAGYLKLFIDNLCRGAYSRDPLEKYDAILLDEAHDTDPVVERLFRHLAHKARHSLVMVGDPHQAIYAWRGAINAIANFSRFDAVKNFNLTQSFRFGHEIARLANQVLDLSTSLKRGPDVQGVGGEKIQGDQRATIARTNRTLIENAARLLQADPALRIHFTATTKEAGWSPEEPYNFNLFRSVHALRNEEWIKGAHPRVRHFKTFRDLTRYLDELKDDAGDSLDAELAGAVAFVNEHDDRVPGILDSITKASTSPVEAAVTFSTAHRSKGSEWDTVTLLDDFKILDAANEEVFSQEEVNLLYVAVTRARQRITVNGQPVVIPEPPGKHRSSDHSQSQYPQEEIIPVELYRQWMRGEIPDPVD